MTMSAYDFFKIEPIDGPTYRPQTIGEVDVHQSVLEDIA
jgi:hypothetical protein